MPGAVVLSHINAVCCSWLMRKVISLLMQHSDFDATVTKHVSAKDARSLKEVVNQVITKGIGEMPSDSPSAKGARRSGTLYRSSRMNSAESTDSLPQRYT